MQLVIALGASSVKRARNVCDDTAAIAVDMLLIQKHGTQQIEFAWGEPVDFFSCTEHEGHAFSMVSLRQLVVRAERS